VELQVIRFEDIPFGQPLPWHVYDRDEVLLLRKGEVVHSHHQLDDLRVDGLFIPKNPQDEAPPPEPPKQSPFAVLSHLPSAVERLFGRMSVEPNFKGRTHAIAKSVQEACAIDRDASLGWLFLGPECRYVIGHPIRAAIVCELVGLQLNWPETEREGVLCAALTMNIGQLVLQHKLLGQKEALAPKQREDVRRHCQDGNELLERLEVTDLRWLEAVTQHHERLDGSGYPRALSGDAIAPGARLLAIADIYCALVTEHAHRRALLPNAALKELYLMRAKGLDGAMVEQFIKVAGVYPPGTLVKLANGELAVVSRHGATATTPIVHSVVSPRGGALNVYPKRESSDPQFAIKEVLSHAKANVTINHKPGLWGYKR
jgi:HD-GYP domain-containing protein (c-di-GMP phosphodiesterase class II)